MTPVLASNVVLYSYNGVIAPELPVSNYSYAFIYTTIEGNIMAWISGEGVAHPYVVSLSSGSGTGLYMPAPVAIYRYNPGSEGWEFRASYSTGLNNDFQYMIAPYWCNVDVSGVVSGSSPVLYFEESPVMDILSTTSDSSSIHTNFNVSGISSDSLYTIVASCFSGEQVVGSSAVGPYSGPEFQATVSVGGLSPSTEYTVEYQLSKDGEYTGVSQTVTATTAAASGSGSGDGSDNSGSCACPSILNSILSAITAQTNFLSTWQQTWTTRMDSFESTLSKLIPVPDPTETALKESVKDTTDSFTKEFWSAESDNALGSASITESADVLSNTKGLFDTGVSTSDFFGLFGDSSWGHWFSEETRSDLHTVPSVSAVDLYGDEEKSTYEKNLDSIRNFMGG